MKTLAVIFHIICPQLWPVIDSAQYLEIQIDRNSSDFVYALIWQDLG